MTLSRRSVLKPGVSAGVLPLLGGRPFDASGAEPETATDIGEVVRAAGR